MQVLAGQVRSNLWVRNGQSMAQKVSLLHENVHTLEIFDLDIALMQGCAVLCRSLSASTVNSMNPDLFVTTIVYRFGLLEFFNSLCSPNPDDSKGEITEDSKSPTILRRLSQFFQLKKTSSGSNHEDESADVEFNWMQSIPHQQKVLLAEQCLRLLIILANDRGIIGNQQSFSSEESTSFTTDPLSRRHDVCISILNLHMLVH